MDKKRWYDVRRNAAGAGVVLCAGLLLPTSPLQAADWQNPGAGSWANGVNWNPAGVPTAGDSVTVDNGGTVQIDAADAVSADAQIGSGAGTSGSILVYNARTWTNSGDLYVGYAGSGTLGISDGGAVVSEGTVFVASVAGSIGRLNIGAASGEAAVAAGTLDAASLAFGDGDGKLVFNHTDNGLIFGAAISGNGEVLVESGKTVFKAAAAHGGGTTISGGTLQLGDGGTTGALAGDVTNDGTFAIDRSDAYTYVGVMSGSGDFRQLGAGTTTLTGDSSGFAGASFHL